MVTFIDFDFDTPVCNCRKCGTRMRVFGIEHHEILEGMALRSLECPRCINLQTDVIPFVQVNGTTSRGPLIPTGK